MHIQIGETTFESALLRGYLYLEAPNYSLMVQTEEETGPFEKVLGADDGFGTVEYYWRRLHIYWRSPGTLRAYLARRDAAEVADPGLRIDRLLKETDRYRWRVEHDARQRAEAEQRREEEEVADPSIRERRLLREQERAAEDAEIARELDDEEERREARWQEIKQGAEQQMMPAA